MSARKKKIRTFSVAATLTLVYLAVGLMWVYFFDYLLLSLTNDGALVLRVQSVKGWLFILVSAGFLYALTRILTGKIIRAHQHTIQAYQQTIDSLVSAIELRDLETGAHSERVVGLALELAEELDLPADKMEPLGQGALLHDIGKIGVPDRILLKPGKLTAAEWKTMHRHAHRGYELLASVPHLKKAAVVPLYHQERWDGSGYPEGLKGKKIPIEARVFAVVDVWDALTSPRPYRPAWSETKAFEYIVENAGKQFDPVVVDGFVNLKQAGVF